MQDVFSKAHDKKAVELLHKMEAQVDRLNLLIVDLLDFTRIEGGKLKFREENYSMNELIKEAAEEIQRTSRSVWRPLQGRPGDHQYNRECYKIFAGC